MITDDAFSGMRQTQTEQGTSHRSKVQNAENAARLAYERLQAEKSYEAKEAYEAAWSVWIGLMMSRTPLHNA